MRQLILLISLFLSTLVSADDSLRDEVRISGTTEVDYSFRLSGDILVPGEAGEQKFDIESDGSFRFQQRHVSVDDVHGIRFFESAQTKTKVDDHATSTRLPTSLNLLHFKRRNGRVTAFHSSRLLSRKQVNLMQMPFDPLVLTTTLPTTSLKQGDKWNLESWQLPLLVGVDAAVEQSATCELTRVTDTEAEVRLTGKLSGAVSGSAANINVSAEYRFNRRTGRIIGLKAQQKEKRTAGPVSPGLNVTANIRWSQQEASTPVETLSSSPVVQLSESRQMMELTSQSGLELKLSREWHEFHETPAVLMVRQLRDGRLISQCNVSRVRRVAPGSHTSDQEFRRDVEESVSQRKGRVTKEETLDQYPGWRVRHVNAVGAAGEETIVWDYFLCSAENGKQYSLVFSRSDAESKAFGNEADKVLKSMRLVK